MPGHEVHARDSLRKYGKRFDSLHTWMDQPWEILGKQHRMYRHNPRATPTKARELFGKFADDACLDHIILDWRHSPKRFRSLSKFYLRQGSAVGSHPHSSASSARQRTQPTGIYANLQASKETSLHKEFSNAFRELAKLFSELDALPHIKGENLQKTSKDSLGTKAQDLFNMFILLKTIKYVIPG